MRTSTPSAPATSPRTSARWYSGIEIAGVGDGAEFAEFGVAVQPSATRRTKRSCLHAVADQVGHRDHLQVVADAEFHQLGHARHGAVVVHDFADDAGGREAGQAGQIHGGFGLAGAHQDAAFARAQGENVAGAGQVGGRQSGSMAVRMVRVRSAAEMPVVTPSRASMDSQNAVPKVEVLRGAHQRQAQGVAASPA